MGQLTDFSLRTINLKKPILIFLGFLALTAGVYHNSLRNGFFLDDYTEIVDNGSVRDLSQLPRSLAQFDRTNKAGMRYYRPFSIVFRTVLYQFFRSDPAPYHGVNIFLFALLCYAVYRCLWLLTGEVFVSLLTALLFCLHPINSTEVNFVTAHEMILYSLFCVLSVIFFLRSLNIPGRAFSKPALASVFFFILALLTQPISVTLPVVLFLIAWAHPSRNVRTALQSVLPFAFVLVLFIVLHVIFIEPAHSVIDDAFLAAAHPLKLIGTFFSLVGWYITRLFYPVGIVLIWSVPENGGIINPFSLAGVLGLGTILGIVMSSPMKSRAQLAGLWFLVGFVPLSLTSFIYYSAMGQVVEPHWFFFSTIGFFYLAAIMIAKSRKYLPSAIVSAFLLVLAVSFTILIEGYNRVWKDQLTYASYWSGVVPRNPYALRAIGQTYQKQGDPTRAIIYFQKALTYLNNSLLFIDLGDSYASLKQFDQAKKNYAHALELDPSSSRAFSSLGAVLAAQNDILGAEESYLHAVSADPGNTVAHLNLGDLYLKNKNFARAEDHYRQALATSPRMNERLGTISKLAVIAYLKHDLKGMSEKLTIVLKEDSRPQVYVQLGYLFNDLGAPGMGLKVLSWGIEAWPKDKEAYILSGVILANSGKMDDAVKMWQSALALDPQDAQVKRYIAQAQGNFN